MLILARRPGQRVTLDGGITVEVLSVRGEKVRLGFTAPPEITILREERAEGRLPDQEKGHSE